MRCVKRLGVKLFAGTSRGVFVLGKEGIACVLDAAGVREIIRLGDTLCAGTSAGVYCSVDDGNTWTGPHLNDFAICQIRGDKFGTIYVGTHPAELFKSMDGGKNWLRIESFGDIIKNEGWCIPLKSPIPSQARAIVVDASNESQLWVGVEVGGILHSVDAGLTWDVVRPGGNPDLHMIFPHPAKREILFASTGYGRLDGIAEELEGNAGVFRSGDSGQSWDYVWQGITPRYSRPMCIDRVAPFAITVGSAPNAFSSHRDPEGAGAMLFQSKDEGRSWRSICDEAHSPSPVNFHGLTPNPEIPSSVFLGTDNGQIWSVSTDSHWELIAENMPAVLSLMAEGN